MKDVLLGSSFVAISAMVALLSWRATDINVHAAPVPISTRSSSLAAFQSSPDLPDPNIIYATVNKVRQDQGLPPLARSEKLASIAQQRANDMQSNDYYAHKSPSGLYFYDLLAQAGYRSGFGCENLDLEFSKSPDIYVNAWLGSTAGHRECLLDPRVSEAGYAATEVATPTKTNPSVKSYVVVAIYAEAQ